MIIKVPENILTYGEINQYVQSKEGLSEVPPPSGNETGGMPAAQDLLALFGEIQGVINSYISLIDYDGERMIKIVDGFIRSDS